MNPIYLTEDQFVAFQMEQIIWLSDHNIFPVGLIGDHSSISVYTCSDYQGPLSWWSGHYFSHKLMGLKSLLKSGNLARGLKLLLGVIILSFLIIHSFFLWIYIFSSSTLIGCPSIFPLCNFILLAISTAFYRSGQAPLWLSLWDCLLLW